MIKKSLFFSVFLFLIFFSTLFLTTRAEAAICGCFMGELCGVTTAAGPPNDVAIYNYCNSDCQTCSNGAPQTINPSGGSLTDACGKSGINASSCNYFSNPTCPWPGSCGWGNGGPYLCPSGQGLINITSCQFTGIYNETYTWPCCDYCDSYPQGLPGCPCTTSPNVYISQTACSGAPYNTCSVNNGTKTQTWQHQGLPNGDWCVPTNYPVYNVACTQDNCDGSNGYTCTSGQCRKPISGKVTNVFTGAGIGGVTIAVFDATKNQTQTTTTASNGTWSIGSFVGYRDGYAVRQQTNCPAGYYCGSTPTSYENQTAGGAPDCYNNCNFTYTRGIVSGTVFKDWNHDGVQKDPVSEPALGAGFTVTTGTKSTTTDSNGNWTINDLAPGTYNFSVVASVGYSPSNSPVPVTVGPNQSGILLGDTPLRAIGGTVFIDYNADGIYETEDFGFSNVGLNIQVSGPSSGNATSSTSVANSVANPSFENGNPPTSWSFNTAQSSPGVPAGTVSQASGVGNYTDGTHSLLVNVTTADAAHYWYINEAQQQPIAYGTTYTLRFDAKASKARKMYVYWQQTVSPWTSYFSSHPSLTLGWQTFVYTIVGPVTDATPNLYFEFAEDTGSVYIDNVSITTTGNFGVPNLLPQNTYSAQLTSAVPAGYKLTSTNPVSVNLGQTDNTSTNFGLAPLFSINGNVYNDINKNTCYNPTVDIPLYTQADTSVIVKSGTTSQVYGPFPVDNTGNYHATNLPPDANGYIVSYVQNKYYDMTTPNSFKVWVGTPGKSIHCDVSQAQRAACN